jgi:hypothetical protein
MKDQYQYRGIIYLPKDKAYGKLDDFYTLEGALMIAEGYALDRKTLTQVIGRAGVIDQFPHEKPIIEKPKKKK